MNILFEIADKDLMIIGAIVVLIIIVIVFILKANERKRVKPISEDERYDNDLDNITEQQRSAREELERVYNQMNADLEKQNNLEDEIEAFENDQEENAIISYTELMAKADELKKKADRYEKIAEEKADIDVQKVIEKKEKPKYQGFKTSDIISPIYGIKKTNEKNSPKTNQNGIISKAYEESETKQNLEFLNSLKEFRKNL